MVVRQQSSVHIPKKYLFNAGVALFLIGTASLAIREIFVPKVIPACSQRYAQTGVFTWTRGDGSLLAAPDLQAKLKGNDWGVLENVKFTKSNDLQLGVAMQVNLPKETGKTRDERKPSGAGFTWAPDWLRGASSTCLAYSVKLPEGFDFGQGGSLPGLYGGGSDAEDTVTARRSSAFSTRLHWRDNALLELRLKSHEHPTGMGFTLDKNYLTIEPGQWVTIEQEVVLNTPGQPDGILRVWVDGKIRLDQKQINYRAKPEEGLRGVVANVHYATRDLDWAPAPKDSAVLLSPFIFRWE